MHRHLRWYIAVLIGIGTIINYFDRANMSVATDPMSKQFGLSLSQMGIVLSAFSWSYTLIQIPIGALLDRIGVKWLTRVGTILWTIATVITAVAGGLGLVILSRILLGVAEAPVFPGNSKATGYWFPVRERGLATASFDAAAKFSNVIGVPLIAWAITVWGWRGGFWLTAVLSVLFAIAYWIWYRDPKEKKSLSREEYDYIVAGGAQTGEAEGQIWANLGFALKQRKIWGLGIGFAAYNYSFYLFLTWLPGYLEKQMHMTVLKSGWYTVMPWLIATITDVFVGGWLVDRLIKQGRDPTRVRKTVLVIGMLLGLAVIGAAFTQNPNWAVVWISISLGGLAFAATICWSIPSLIAPRGTVGSVGSVMNFLGNISGIIAPIVTGFIADATGQFSVAFAVAAAVLVVGIISFVFLLGTIEPIRTSQRQPLP